jgi:hypothetical protein
MRGRTALLLLALPVVAGACGERGGSLSTIVRPVIGHADVGNTVNCLIEHEWLVQPGVRDIQGTSDKGVNFDLRFFDTRAEAKKHATPKKILLGNTVLSYGADVSGQSIGVQGAPANKVTTETKIIETCLKSS